MGHCYLNAQVGARVSYTSPCLCTQVHVAADAALQSMHGWEGHPGVTMLFFLRWPIRVPSWVESFGMLGQWEKLQGAWGLNVVSRRLPVQNRSWWFESGWVFRKIQIPLKKLILWNCSKWDFYCLVSLWFAGSVVCVDGCTGGLLSGLRVTCFRSSFLRGIWFLTRYLNVLLLFNNAFYKRKTCLVPLKVCLPLVVTFRWSFGVQTPHPKQILLS